VKKLLGGGKRYAKDMLCVQRDHGPTSVGGGKRAYTNRVRKSPAKKKKDGDTPRSQTKGSEKKC